MDGSMDDASRARVASEYRESQDDAESLLAAAWSARTLTVQRGRLDTALLDLANGDLKRLRHFAGRAAEDTRDVLYWAETDPQPDEPRTFEGFLDGLDLPPEQRRLAAPPGS